MKSRMPALDLILSRLIALTQLGLAPLVRNSSLHLDLTLRARRKSPDSRLLNWSQFLPFHPRYGLRTPNPGSQALFLFRMPHPRQSQRDRVRCTTHNTHPRILNIDRGNEDDD